MNGIPRYPLILMHGFGAFSESLSGFGFSRVASYLYEQGIAVHAPLVEPYETVAVRSCSWNTDFDRLCARFGYERLNLIGYSMAGLDARYIVSVLGGHERVASVTTVSTPHRGSSLAAFVLDLPIPARDAVIGSMQTVGKRQRPDVEHRVHAALEVLHPDFVQIEFNPHILDHPEVHYFSIRAQAGRQTTHPVSPLFWLHNRILYRYEGINDGFVSVSSAGWGEDWGIVDADHGQLIGIPSVVTRFDINGFYLALARRLADAGF